MNTSTQEAFGNALMKFGLKNDNVVLLQTDGSSMFKTHLFSKYASHRSFNFGLSEADMIGFAAGMAAANKIPFVCGTAEALIGKSWNQIKNIVCRAQLNVKIIITCEENSSEMSLLPGLADLKIFYPADEYEALAMTEYMINDYGPTCLCLSTKESPSVFDNYYSFQEGKPQIIRKGENLCIITYGTNLQEAKIVAEMLKKHNVETEIINLSSCNPLEKKSLLESAAKCRRVVTIGKMAEQKISLLLSSENPLPLLCLPEIKSELLFEKIIARFFNREQRRPEAFKKSKFRISRLFLVKK